MRKRSLLSERPSYIPDSNCLSLLLELTVYCALLIVKGGPIPAHTVGFQEVEASGFSRQDFRPYGPKQLMLIYVRGRVDPRAIVGAGRIIYVNEKSL